jgi:hypothetical protein
VIDATDARRPRRARHFPKFPIAARGFMLYLLDPRTPPARVPRDRYWPGRSSPLRRWLVRNQKLRIRRMTDYTLDWVMQPYLVTNRLPQWAIRFHQELRRRGPAGTEVAREECAAVLARFAPHATYDDPITAQIRAERDRDRLW